MIIKKQEAVEIRHSIPGRIRFKLRPVCFRKTAVRQLSERLRETKGISWVRSNPAASSLIIRYHHDVITKAVITETVRTALDQRGNRIAPRKNTDGPVETSGVSVKSALLRFVGMTVLTGVVFVREVILKRPLAQSLFSPLGIITTIAALPLMRKGLESLRERRFTLESFLGGSIVAAVAVGEATAALEILWITSGAELLQAWITERSRRAIRDILQITEKSTYILVKGVEVEIPADEVRPGDIVVVHTGEKISVDGIVTDGEALLDESPINGRSEFILRKSGDDVFAGTFVRQGVIYVHARKVGDKTYLSRILQMVEDSLENKAPIEGVAEELAAKLIKVGFVATFTTLVITQSLWRAFTVMLVMACPCATILSASTAVSAALSAAAKRHILIKGGRYLEEAGRADIVCFDKTGTLTTNEPELVKLANFSDMEDNALLQMAYSAEKHNSHPVALAIKIEAEKRGIKAIPHDVCDYTLGKGVRAEIWGDEILIGSSKLMSDSSVNTDAAARVLRKFNMQGLTTIFIGRNRTLMGVMGFANQNRPDIQKVVKHLRDDGIEKVVMITGDERCSALDLTRQLDMAECYYSVMPEDKSDIVNELQGNKNKVLMVGDGINDALALAEADIGVAMGAGGSEVAIEAADIALVKDDLKGIIYVRVLSHTTMKVVHQNFWIATGSNIVGVVLGALGILSPVMAGLIHITHTVGILANSSRLLFYEPQLLTNDETCPVQKQSADTEVIDLTPLKKIA
ncbi:heavy metal translocating P-type ATPase [Desulfonema magnum]|uniref:P-type Zn(2+) transporter n=1 Tax=Desulfonema magnum TaxID=45655 RepID=A0A975BJT4_9BACT|nr:cation-translocating P-type ATPase [Desulfonema magnum]QTA87004.1 Heavy metal translocating P-type ATPase [Desulfonema magnum]